MLVVGLPPQSEVYLIVSMTGAVEGALGHPMPMYGQSPPGLLPYLKLRSKLDIWGDKVFGEGGLEYVSHPGLEQHTVDGRILFVFTTARKAEEWARRVMVDFEYARQPVPQLGVVAAPVGLIPDLCHRPPAQFAPVVGALLDYDGERASFCPLITGTEGVLDA